MIKKICAGLLVLSILTVSNTAHASVLGDLKKQIQNLKQELASLRNSQKAEVTGPSNCYIVSYIASSLSVPAGTPVKLSWTTLGCTSASISNIGTVPTSGTQTVVPGTNTDYILTAGDGVHNPEKLTASIIVTGSTPVTSSTYHTTRFATGTDNANFGGGWFTDKDTLTFYDHSTSNPAVGPIIKWEWQLKGSLGDQVITYTTFKPSISVKYPRVNADYRVILTTYDKNGANGSDVGINLKFTTSDQPPAPTTPKPAVLPLGCTSTSGISSVTGLPCGGPVAPSVGIVTKDSSYSLGCESKLGYSTVDGRACSGETNTWSASPKSTTTNVDSTKSTSIGFTNGTDIKFPPGCTSALGYSTTTKESCSGVASISPTQALKPTGLLPGCTSTNGFSTTTGKSCSTSASTTSPKATQTTPAQAIPATVGDCGAIVFTKTLKSGQKNDEVESLQAILNEQGYLIDSAVTGTFNAKTGTALRAWQKANKVLVTGYTGSTTRDILNALVKNQCLADQAEG